MLAILRFGVRFKLMARVSFVGIFLQKTSRGRIGRQGQGMGSEWLPPDDICFCSQSKTIGIMHLKLPVNVKLVIYVHN